MTSTRFAVIGGGILGTAVARRLLDQESQGWLYFAIQRESGETVVEGRADGSTPPQLLTLPSPSAGGRLTVEEDLVVSDPVDAETAALGALSARAGIRPTELAEIVYAPRNCDAARQLYRVASGLESMIVGEAEVQGQVRRAYDAAVAAGSSNFASRKASRACGGNAVSGAGRRVTRRSPPQRSRISASVPYTSSAPAKLSAATIAAGLFRLMSATRFEMMRGSASTTPTLPGCP